MKKHNHVKPEAAPLTRSAAVLALFKRYDIDVQTSGGFDPWTVGDFLFWPETSRWRAKDGSAEGYGALELALRAKSVPEAVDAVARALAEPLGPTATAVAS